MTFLLAIGISVWTFRRRHASALIAASGLPILALLNVWIGFGEISVARWRWVDFEWDALPEVIFAIGVALRYFCRSAKAVPQFG